MQKYIIAFLISVLMFLVGVGVGLGIGYMIGKEAGDNDRNITSYQACVDAGGAILESYPPQCMIDGKSFTDTSVPPVTDPGTPTPSPDPGQGSGSGTSGTTGADGQTKLTDAYGFSTNFRCAASSDCTAGGCGGEVCGGKSEELVSTCILPTDQKYAKDAGYTCGCVQNQCAWSK